MRAFKLLRAKGGRLYPLYVFADEETPVGVWLDAKCGERNEDGKVKSRLGPLAYRPGWHLSEHPIANHIGVKEDGVVRFMHPDSVWCECEFSDHIDYQEQADENGRNADGRVAQIKACLSEIPVDGFYHFRTNPLMTGDWIIAGRMKIERVLTDTQVNEILRSRGIEPMPRYGGAFDSEKYGFEL